MSKITIFTPVDGGDAVILTEIDMGMSHETGQSKWSDAGEDISAAIREVTGHWLEPINALAANDA